MRYSVIAATLMLTTSAPALAQNLDALRDGLNHLPATLMFEQHGDIAYFLDVQVMMGLGANDSAVRPFFRAMPTASINALDSLARTEPAEWEAKAGTTIDTLRYFAGHGRPPEAISYWGLADDTAASDMIARLQTIGFESAGVPGVVGNGEALRFDPAKRNPSDPWRSQVGAAQFAAVKGTNVVQAPTPQAAVLAAAQKPSLGETPIIQTALAGLDRSVGDSQIVQVQVISPIFGMAGLDPAVLLSPSPDMEETRKRMEEQMATLGQGIPPYLGGLVADVQHEQSGVGIALAYSDCSIAQEAADAIAARWSEMAGDAAQGDITATTAEGEGGFCAATVSVFVDADSPEQSPAYRVLIESYMRGQAGILQIGQN